MRAQTGTDARLDMIRWLEMAVAHQVEASRPFIGPKAKLNGTHQQEVGATICTFKVNGYSHE